MNKRTYVLSFVSRVQKMGGEAIRVHTETYTSLNELDIRCDDLDSELGIIDYTITVIEH